MALTELSELNDTDLDIQAARTLGLTVIEKDGMFFLKSKKKRNETDTRFIPHYSADISSALELLSHVVESKHHASAPFRVEILVENARTAVRIISDKHGVMHSVSISGELRKCISRAITQSAIQWANELSED